MTGKLNEKVEEDWTGRNDEKDMEVEIEKKRKIWR